MIISCACTELLLQHNKATLLKLIQRDYNNNNGLSVDSGNGICMLFKSSAIGFSRIGLRISAVLSINKTSKGREPLCYLYIFVLYISLIGINV